jgi:hypothetical protein
LPSRKGGRTSNLTRCWKYVAAPASKNRRLLILDHRWEQLYILAKESSPWGDSLAGAWDCGLYNLHEAAVKKEQGGSSSNRWDGCELSGDRVRMVRAIQKTTKFVSSWSLGALSHRVFQTTYYTHAHTYGPPLI